MPISSVETFFACSLMVILVVAGMAATTKVVQPFLDEIPALSDYESYKELSEYLLLSAGEPASWGRTPNSSITIFGLASETGIPYDLDIDKITRLNGNNINSISYNKILEAVNIPALALKIRIDYLFDININLTSILVEENTTTYTFQVFTLVSGSPIPAWMQCYTVVGNYVRNCSASTDANGESFITVSLPSSIDGKAMFLAFAEAKANPQIVSFKSHFFVHNSDTFEENLAFLSLHPLNHILNVSFTYPTVEVSNAFVFTYKYHFNLTSLAASDQAMSFRIPNLLDSSPMILLLEGKNASTSDIELVSYPQLPLEAGTDFQSTNPSRVVSLTYTIRVNSVLYKLTMFYQTVEDHSVEQ